MQYINYFMQNTNQKKIKIKILVIETYQKIDRGYFFYVTLLISVCILIHIFFVFFGAELVHKELYCKRSNWTIPDCKLGDHSLCIKDKYVKQSITHCSKNLTSSNHSISCGFTWTFKDHKEILIVEKIEIMGSCSYNSITIRHSKRDSQILDISTYNFTSQVNGKTVTKKYSCIALLPKGTFVVNTILPKNCQTPLEIWVNAKRKFF